ncbi:cysteine-rich hydrophobic domain-containing protein 1-like [Anthonomus grandis grandis]|uniref:cysteine-rich hydrophobic domain-containing protein 1-like n=1 Tax=Anthonomus grandis grandis TaxID=2921223 RepID=UPI0021666427|nr:cysteine-rich hydrophobic domain-containing protein 1-like [Anthonomus grandis grandis]XP_050311665.1 cysteine-rich hydrophobic domain-containing protein 1-like [Anthonomus grandis grandis]
MSQNNRILIRGDGRYVVYGIHSHYKLDLPPKLKSQLAPEEFQYTVGQINALLANKIPKNFITLLGGCSLCLCSAGLTLGPSLLFNKIIKKKIKRILDKENKRMYNGLGMHWSLVKEKFGLTVEYGLLVEFIQKAELSPD